MAVSTVMHCDLVAGGLLSSLNRCDGVRTMGGSMVCRPLATEKGHWLALPVGVVSVREKSIPPPYPAVMRTTFPSGSFTMAMYASNAVSKGARWPR